MKKPLISKSVMLMFAATILFSLSAMAGKKSADNSIKGWVSDVACGAKGARAGHTECAKKCADKGVALALVTDKGHSVWTIENPDAVKGHEGHHVAVSGATDSAKHTIKIDNVAMLADQGKPGSSADIKHDDDMHKNDK